MSYENIIVDINDGVCVITFNRPKAMNALNQALLEELSYALDKVSANNDIRVVVLTGAGKAFVAGADITELAKLNPLEGKLFATAGHDVMNKIQALPIPVIGAVNGFALGGGSEMALACDFIYAGESAKFGLPEITLGIIPGFGGTQRLPAVVGKNIAKEMIFTGKMISAQEAKEIGMVNSVYKDDELMSSVLSTAKSIASKGSVSLRAAKIAVSASTDVDLATGCKIEIDSFALCLASEDAKEGTTAFIEKRKAAFSGNFKK